MGERSNATIWHEDIEVGKTRRIAARGIIPNYLAHPIEVNGITGRLIAFEHFAETTVVTVRVDQSNQYVEFDLGHLDEVEIEY